MYLTPATINIQNYNINFISFIYHQLSPFGFITIINSIIIIARKLVSSLHHNRLLELDSSGRNSELDAIKTLLVAIFTLISLSPFNIHPHHHPINSALVGMNHQYFLILNT